VKARYKKFTTESEAWKFVHGEDTSMYVTFYLYLFLRGGLRPALRPSINCGPICNPDI